MVALVTGASDGIGRDTAERLFHGGYTVYGISRTSVKFPFCRHIAEDVSDMSGVSRAVGSVFEKEGQIDLVVLCAGVSLASCAEEVLPEMRRLFDINFWGCVHVLGEVVPRMKAARQGRIILISSMLGVLPIPYLGFYSASKAAIAAYTCALANELKPFGIAVSAVLPGGVRTAFTMKRKIIPAHEKQAPGLMKAVRTLGYEEQTGLYPREVAREIIKLVRQKSPPVLCPVGGIYRLYAWLKRVMPHRLILFILRKKYSV